MYAPVLGRPELDPVFLAGVTLLQIMERLPDRQTVQACWFDARWRMALGIEADWKGVDPTTLVCFRGRMAEHGEARRILEACLTAMRAGGYLKARGPVRIDSTHVLGDLARLSRLECVRETLRLALLFLCELGGPGCVGALADTLCRPERPGASRGIRGPIEGHDAEGRRRHPGSSGQSQGSGRCRL